jgi:probable phosphoglycerate mutase
VAEQLKGNYRVKEPRLQRLHLQAKDLLAGFPEVAIKHVEREKNKGADALANMAIDAQVKKERPHG